MLPQRKQLMDMLENHLENILKNHIIQETRVTKKDIELWDTNPKNYVYKKFDISENFFIKRYNVTQFVKSICSYKKKNESGKRYPAFFHVFYKYFVDILKTYEEQKVKGQTPDLRIKEAIFEILHSISEQIENYAPETIEELLRSFVIKELDSEVGMLRERACELCQSFSIKYIQNNDLFKYIVEYL
jgi:valyl-tRNA synthetase